MGAKKHDYLHTNNHANKTWNVSYSPIKNFMIIHSAVLEAMHTDGQKNG